MTPRGRGTGYEELDTRIADVADRTGTSPALVIYYSKTRDQLLTEAIRYSEDAWYAEGTRRMAGIPSAAGQLGFDCNPVEKRGA
jgi:AcrR family transcriptional regulator